MNNEDRYQTVWLVRRLFRAMARVSEERLKEQGISVADRAVLEFLYPDARLAVPEIADRYDVSRQHVQVTVNRLLAAGLVATRNNPRHKRSPHVVLSPAGRALFKKIRSHDLRLVDRLFANIPDKSLQTTNRTLRTIWNQLNEGEL